MNEGSAKQPMVLRLGLYGRALLLIGFVLAAITIVVTYQTITLERRDLTRQLEARAKELTSSQVVALSGAVWELNRDNVRLILEGLAQDPDFVAGEVTDEKGRTFAELRRRRVEPAAALRKSVDLYLERPSGPRKIGALGLTLSKDRLFAAQRHALLKALLLGAIQLIAVLVAVGLGLRAVIRPLARITDRMVGVAAGDLDSPVPHLEREDPIGNVARAVEAFRNASLERVAAQRALKSAHDELERRVDERTRELQATQRQFKDIAQSSADWFWETDADLRFTHISDNASLGRDVPREWYYGMTRKELRGEDYDREAWAAHEAALARHEPFKDFEYLRTVEGGKQRWVRVSGVPVFDDDGVFTGYRGTGSDITEYRATKEQLVQAQKMEAVGQLTGGVAHDFNNLLAVIMGNAELLAEKPKNADRLISNILRASARGAELTKLLLAYSRRQPLHPRPVDLARLVPNMQALLERTLGETIDVRLDLASDLWPVLADPGQVENALLNLALNARDAMPQGGTVTIACSNAGPGGDPAEQESEGETGDFVLLSVRDTGTGMTAEIAERAFEPFFTTKEVGHGSGLGLSMVYGFTKQSGGHVAIDSDEGAGTTVRLYLPRAGAVKDADADADGAAPVLGQGEMVLLVEDDADVRELVEKMITSLGYRVATAATADEARATLSGTDIDMMLTDVILPGGVSGPALAEEVRRDDPTLPIVFMSGYPAGAAGGGPRLGADDVLLSKPFQKIQVASAIRTALEGAAT
ncbi:MAG: response regulator [Alphaproteobacteria bacterium]|nr:response regulator [Alphaproteobacteria bacterium]